MIVTRSRSIYHVVESTRGEFLARVDNVANPRSVAIDPDRWWRIEPAVPWPPEVGKRLQLLALLTLPFEHAERMPGGGKVTSPVVELEDLTWIAGDIGLGPI